MIVGAVAPVYERFLDSDFSASWTEGPFSILIPITNSSTNIAALVQPMNIEVCGEALQVTHTNFSGL